jgi:chaperonin GroES
MVRRKDEFNFS